MATKLDPSQRDFCEAPLGDIRLLAPAGCGKTQCLLYRSKHLIDQASKRPPRILIVTFTRVARDELTSRFADLNLSHAPDVTTLNAWGFRRIKSASFSPKLITNKADYHFAMLNQLQSVWQRPKHKHIKAAIETKNSWRRANAPRMLMGMIDSLKSLGFDHKHNDEEAFLQHWRELESQHLLWKILQVVDQLEALEILDEGRLSESGQITKSDLKQMYRRFYKFWCDATEHLAREATFTLEDQKYFAYQEERRNVDEKKFLSGAARYNHVLVDEFQDINPLDLALIKAISERNRAYLTIAGDDDQAIFEWRGATPEYIIDPDRFLGRKFTTHLLRVNYRSPRNIVEHSQLLIQNNSRRVNKDVRSSSSKRAKIELRKVENITAALDFVNCLVTHVIEEGKSPSRVALISRKRSQIIPYQVFFASQDIHFGAAEDLQIFLSDAFSGLLDLLVLKASRIPRARVTQTILHLCDLVKRYPLNRGESEGLKRFLASIRPNSVEAGIEALSSYTGRLKGSNANRQTSIAMSRALNAFMDENTVAGTLDALASEFEGLQYDFGKSEDDIFYTDPPFFHLARYAESYGDDFDSFIEDLEKARDTLAHVPPFEEGGDTAVSDQPLHLMTALRSKGKEFDIVIMLDVIDGIWPNKNAKTKTQLEGERRVFYVAFTRAKKRVVILTDNQHAPSPYIAELGLK